MEDDDDKMVRDVEFFIALRKTLSTDTTNNEKIAQIEEFIKNGVDVNIRFANNANNTPLHIAVIKGESDIVKILLKHGAETNVVNDAGKTALDIAKLLSGRLDIVEMLTEQDENTEVKDDEAPVTVTEYKKRPGTANIRGQLYETKLLTMIYFRALRCKEITQFYLATNVDEVGDIDDVCLRFKTEKNDYVVFLQAKYKLDVVKGRIRYHDLWQATNDFSLLKCYVSYMKIREKFDINSEDDFFRGNYEDLKPYYVMYTTIKDDIKEIRKITRPPVDKLVDNLIGTGKQQHIFKFTSEDDNVELIVRTLLQEQMITLGKKLVQFMKEGKYAFMLSDENILRYHVVLAQKVIKLSEVGADGLRTGAFREEFLSSNDALLITLRETFCVEIKENTSLTLNEMDVSIQNILHKPVADNICVLIGRVIIYNRTNSSLKLINEGNGLNPKYQRQLAAMRVPESVINEALARAGRRKLENFNDKLKFPAGFGNIDMTLIENKRSSRLDYLAKILSIVINNAPDKENVILREGVFSPCKKQDEKMLAVNGGIGGAVGNLLITDSQNKLKFNLSAESMERNAQGLLERLTEKLGDLQMYRFCVEVDNFPRLSLNGSDKERRFARDFLNSLYFYTFQKKEEDLEDMMTGELQKYECGDAISKVESYIKSNALYLKVHNEIQLWWMLEKSAKYLTRNMKEFDKIFREIKNKGLLTFLSFIYLNEISNTGLKFTSEALEVLVACKGKNTTETVKMIVVQTDGHLLTCHKLVQYCNDAENYIFIDIDYVCKVSPNCLHMITDELSRTDIRNVVIVCEDITKYNVNYIISACRAEKIIIVTSNHVQMEGCVYVRDDRIHLTDLTDAWQIKLLESRFNYQGYEVTFTDVFDETMKRHINVKILQKIINNEQITLGQPLDLSSYKEVKDFYVPRTLKYNEELSGTEDDLDESTIAGTLYQLTPSKYFIDPSTHDDSKSNNVFTPSTLIDHRDVFKDRCQKQPYDVVLLLDGPGAGKSTLLTHLSLETKRRYPKLWIQRLNLIDHSKQFYEWHDKGIEIDYAVALNFLCNIGLSKATATDGDCSSASCFGLEIDIEKLSLADNKVDDALLSFELNVFLQSFKDGRVIFLFDGFDEIYPIYKREVTQLIKCLACRQMSDATMDATNPQQQCVWIASRPYSRLRKILVAEFGDSYTLLPFTYKDINLYLHKYIKQHFALNSLTKEQLKNINDFFEHMEGYGAIENSSAFNLESTYMLLRHMYITALKHFKSEIQRTPLSDDLAYVKKWDIELPPDVFPLYMKTKPAISLLGVPLYVYIAVDYYKTQIRDVPITTNEDPKKKWGIDTNVCAFYESFFETKLKTIWFQKKNDLDIYKPGVITIYEKEKKEFRDIHKKLAFYALFKKLLTKDELEEVDKIIANMQFGENKTGLIERIVNGVPKFIHFTFVEYFAVEYIMDLMKSSAWDKLQRITHLLMAQVVSGRMSGILVFLNLKFKLDPDLVIPSNGPRVNCLDKTTMSIPEFVHIIRTIVAFMGGVE